MKKMNLWKLFFTAMMVFAATAFTACVDDNEDNGMPFLDVTPDVLSFSASGEAVDGVSVFTVKSNRPWELMIDVGGEWVTASPTKGNSNATVEILVPASNEGRITTLNFQLRNTYGAYMTKTVTVQQGDAPKAGPISELNEYIRTALGSTASGTTVDLNYSQATVEGVILANNEGGNNFGKLYIGDNISLPNSAVILYDTKMFTKANSVNYPVGKKVTLNLSSAQYAPYGNLRELKNVAVTVSEEDAVDVVVPSLTAAQLNAGNYQGQYVKVLDLTPQQTYVGEAWATGSKRKVVLDAAGEATVQSYMSDNTETNASDFGSLIIVGNTGPMFGTAEQNFDNIQLIPTKPSDVAAFVSDAPMLNTTPSDKIVLGAAAGVSSTISVVSNLAWTVSTNGSGFSIDPASGQDAGTVTVTTTAANDDQAEKELGSVTFTADGVEPVIIKVMQSGKVDALFVESFGDLEEKLASWPYLDAEAAQQYLVRGGYGYQGGSSYSSYSASVRWTATTSPAAATAGFTGKGHMWLAGRTQSGDAYFAVNQLTLTNETGIDFSFGILAGTKALDLAKDTPTVYVSFDGEGWIKVDYTVSEPLNGTEWKKVSGSYDFPQAASQLWFKIAYEYTDGATNISGLRIEDVLLTARTGGVLPTNPSVVTVAATNVAQTTATIGGELKNAAIGDYSAVGVQYAERPASGSVDWSQAQKKAATLATPWSVDLTDLTKATVYVFRAYATPKTGDELYSAEATFTTLDEEVNPAGNLIVNFSSADIASPALPLVDQKGNGTATYTIDGREYVVSSSSYYWIDYSTKEYGIAPFTALYLKGLAANNTTPGYIQFPAIAGKKLTKVEAVAAGNMGGSVMVSIVDTENNVIEGGASTKFTKPSVTFTLTGTQANTAYRFYVDASNAQINKLGLTYEDDGAAPQPSLTPATASMEFAAEADATGQTQDYTIANAEGLQLFATVADATNFKAEVNDKTVKVTTLTANETAEARTTTVTVYLAATQDGEKKATATINVTQAAKAAASSDITIPELLALNKGDKVSTSGDKTLKAVVCGDPTGDNFSFGTMYVMTEGATTGGNGIVFYNAKSAEFDVTKYPLGTKLIITLKEGVAAIDEYSGTKQVTGVTNADIATDGTVTVTPITVTPGKLAEFVSMPVTVQDASIGEGGIWCTAKKGGVHTFTTAGTNFVVSVNKRAAMFQDIPFAAATGSVSGIGILFNGAGQIAPRNLEDVKAFEVTSPVILDVTPSSLSWNFDNTAAQEVNVSVAGSSAALSVNDVAIAPFMAAINGTTITVTPPLQANETDADIVKTMTVSIAGGNSMDVTLTQKKKPAATEGAIFWKDDFSQFDSQKSDGTDDISSKLTGSVADFTDKYSNCAKVYAGQFGTLKFGSSSALGTLTTPTMKNISGASASAELTLDLKTYGTDKTQVVITVNNGGKINGEASVTTTQLTAEMQTLTYSLEGITPETTITIAAKVKSKNRFYLDNLSIIEKK